MHSIIQRYSFLFFAALLAIALLQSACNKDEESGPGIALYSFGPSPALRGGELRFIGVGLDQVSAVILPENVRVTDFKSRSSELLVIVVPRETVAGKVRLVTPQGEIEAKSLLTISEPIAITTFGPGQVRPGGVVTFEGTYLNLIEAVTFASKKTVGDTAFISQSETKLEVRVPLDAQTGPVILLSGGADPVEVSTETPLTVTLPSISKLSPNPVIAGTKLVIEGKDLDLAQSVTFTGGSKVTEFISATPERIELTVPANAQDGPVRLTPASQVEVASTEELVMVVPTINSISPNPAKSGKTITVRGEQLQLVTAVSFGGGATGTIQAASPTELTISVPLAAKDAALTFRTAANKSVMSAAPLTLVKPQVTSFVKSDVKATEPLTIRGQHLDLVKLVRFGGGLEVKVENNNENELTVNVPAGATSGTITLVAVNGDEVVPAQLLNVLPSTNSVITNISATVRPGGKLTIEGRNLDEISEIIFPGNIRATRFGIKTSTLIEVFVPLEVKTGEAQLTFVTFDGQTFQSPLVNISGVDPVADASLVFFNFDNLGSWWGDAGGIENQAELSLNGTNYFRVNKNLNGWAGLFWRNAQNNFPAAVIGTKVADYVLKFDVNVLSPMTGGELAWRLKGSSGDYWYGWRPWEATGSYSTNGWITVTIPLTAFTSGGKPITDLNTITEDFGVAFNNGSSLLNLAIDNVRFERK